MIEAIIFDFDGVLFDSERLHLQAANSVLQPFGVYVSDEIYFKYYAGVCDQQIFPLLLEAQGIRLQEIEMKALIGRKVAAYREIIENAGRLDAIPGILPFLESIASQVKHFAIYSASSILELGPVLSKLEEGKLRPYFEAIVTIEDVMHSKPSPEGYLKASNLLGIASEHCLVIEDTPKGIAAGKAANMKVVGIATSHEPAALQQADHVVESYVKLQKIGSALFQAS